MDVEGFRGFVFIRGMGEDEVPAAFSSYEIEPRPSALAWVYDDVLVDTLGRVQMLIRNDESVFAEFVDVIEAIGAFGV